MSSDFTRLASHMQAALDLAPDARANYVDSLPPDIARQVRDLLQFKDASLDLSQARGIELALDVLAEPLPTHVGRWTILQPLGHGGMASVFQVERSEGAIRQLAACKIGYARTDLEDGLRRETATLLDLNHPGIAHVLDFGHTDGERPWMVSELVEGSDIVSWANENRLPLAARLLIFEDVLSAVAHAHERLLLHQDIKPDNILVDSSGRPRLIDFGLASVLSGGGDSPVLGYTPRFASPEQTRGDNLTVRSDIYSLGITLAALLEEAAATRGEEDAQAVIAKATREEPAERYASAVAMAADLRAIRESHPVSARANTRGYRLKRFLQRHPLPVALGTLALLSIGVGITATIWQAQRAIDSARVAKRALADARTVEDFLIQDVLGRANPSSPDYDAATGIVGALDKAAAGVDQRFAGNPLAAAGIHATLSSAQRSLGRFEQAATHATLSTRLYARELGDMHELTLTSRYLIVRALTAGRLTEAQKLLDETDRLAGQRLSADTQLALVAATARALLEQNRLSGAEALVAYQRVAALQSRIAPNDSSLKAFADSGLAEAYLRKGEAPQAIRVLEASPLESFPAAHQASIHLQLARAYRDLATYDQALGHAQQAMTINRNTLGNDAYSTLNTMGSLSNIYELSGDCQAALEMGTEAYVGMRRVYGESVQATLIERGNLGTKQFKCARQQEGLANLFAAIQSLRERYGPDNVALSSFTTSAAEFLTQLGRYDEAMDRLAALPLPAIQDDEAREVLDALQEKLNSSGDASLARRLDKLRAKAGDAPRSTPSDG